MNSKTNGFIPISVPFLSGNEQKYLNECIKSNYVSTVGPFVNKIEKKISRLSGTKYCSAVSSGTAALQLSLLSCGIKPKELIIIPSYTFIATANAITHAGAEPWIFDIEKNHWNLDFDQVEKILEKMTFFHNNELIHKITNQKISAIMPVFSFGLPINFEKAHKIARKFKIKLIIDAAAGIGARFNKKKIGNFKFDALTFSFNGNKNITSGGGGAIITNNERVFKKVSLLANTGKTGKNYDHQCVAFNYKMTNIQAAVGLAQLEKIHEILKKKRKIFLYYKNNIKKKELSFFPESKKMSSTHWLSGILLKNKKKTNKLISQFIKNNIEAKNFWKPIHLQKPYKNHLCEKVKVSEEIWKNILTLPSGANLQLDDLKKICKLVNKNV